MQFLIVLSICVVAAAAYPNGYGVHQEHGQSNQGVQILQLTNTRSSSSLVPHILRLQQQITEDVANNVQFETSNGIQTEDNTQILPGSPDPYNPNQRINRIAKSGFFRYTSPEGVPVNIRWTADAAHGFQAFGSVIPTSPPAPSVVVPAYTGNGY